MRLGQNPYGDAYSPLTDASWMGIPASVWNVTAAPPPPYSPPPGETPVALPPTPRSLAVKFTQQTLKIDTTARSILPERVDRQYLLIQNATGSGVIYIGFNEVPNISTGIEIIAGGAYELRNPAPSNQVYVVCPSGDATVRVLEG